MLNVSPGRSAQSRGSLEKVFKVPHITKNDGEHLALEYLTDGSAGSASTKKKDAMFALPN